MNERRYEKMIKMRTNYKCRVSLNRRLFDAFFLSVLRNLWIWLRSLYMPDALFKLGKPPLLAHGLDSNSSF